MHSIYFLWFHPLEFSYLIASYLIPSGDCSGHDIVSTNRSLTWYPTKQGYNMKSSAKSVNNQYEYNE